MKLIGNSSYGKLITNKEKHHDIICVDESEIGAEIMDKHFYSLTELPNGYYEVEKTKQRIILDLLIHLSVFILNYAKLRMLEFIMIVSINTFHVRTFSTVRWTRIQRIWQSLVTVLKVLLNLNSERNSKRQAQLVCYYKSAPRKTYSRPL